MTTISFQAGTGATTALKKLFSEATIKEIAERFYNSMAGDNIIVETLDGGIASVHLGWRGEWDITPANYHVEGYGELSIERKRVIAQIIQVAERVIERDQETTYKYLFQVAQEDSFIARRCFEAYQEEAIKYQDEG